MSALHGLRARKGAVLLRTEEDGTEVWRYQHRTLRVSPAHGGQPSHYSPFPSRRAFYESTGGRDWRPTRWFAEFVRERRPAGHVGRAAKPGPQSTKD